MMMLLRRRHLTTTLTRRLCRHFEHDLLCVQSLCFCLEQFFLFVYAVQDLDPVLVKAG